MPIATSSQTIGPYWHLLKDDSWSDLTRFGAQGEAITLSGRITDGGGNLITDACVEIWQPSPEPSPSWDGFGRAATNAEGIFTFKTLRPGPIPSIHGPRGNTMQAPHVALTILARGLLKALVTRIYFQGDEGHDTDPVLNMIENPTRRATLIAQETTPKSWFLDIHIQGPNETVFLHV